MDLSLSEEQELIRDTAREFLASECTSRVVRAMENDARGYPPELWHKMAELGWLAMPFGEQYGGTENSFVDLCVLLEEQGRVLLPAPFLCTVVLCGLAIARFGTEAQKEGCLSAIARGERILTYAYAEPGRPTWGAPVVEVGATRDGDAYVLNGTKMFVPYAQAAEDMLVAACTTHGSGNRGVTLLLVPAGTGGVTCEPLDTIGNDHQCRVTFDGVRIPAENVLGADGEGEAVARAIDCWGAAAKCAEMIGGAERVLEMTVDYAKQRTAFGRPIGSFQAVQHHCANMALDIETARFLAYEAVWGVSEGLDAAEQVSAAKAWVSDVYQRVCALGHQVHGAIGFTREYDLQLYFRHARASELSFGDGDYHREQVARLLGI